MISKSPCPKCRESGGDRHGDNLVTFEDGGSHCFACGYSTRSTTPAKERVTTNKPWKAIKGQIVALPDRGLSHDACNRYDYRVAKVNGDVVQVACYYSEGELVAQKIRFPDKTFKVLGSGRDLNFFGQHLIPDNCKRLIITEGEIDAISVYEANGCKYPAISVPNGAAGAVKTFKKNLDWLNRFDSIIIAFDNDEPGRLAAVECARLLRPGKAAIASLPEKDANDCLKSGNIKGLIASLWDAQIYRPDGIVHVKDIKDDTSDIGKLWDYPWYTMTKELYGRGEAELVLHTSGTGMGKTTVLREMMYHDLCVGEPVGIMMLEESNLDTKLELLSMILQKPVKKILRARKINRIRTTQGQPPIEFDVIDDLQDEELREGKKVLDNLPLYMYDHFGSIDSDELLNKLEYMVTGLGCTRVYLDHISIVISGREAVDERKDIDVLMTNLRSFVERTKCHLDAVCHLRKTDKTPFEEGGQVSLRDLRGSGSLAQLSDIVLGYERNQQNPDPDTASTILVRVLKDRFGGNTGPKLALRYNRETCRLNEVDFVQTDSGIEFQPTEEPTE